MRYVRRFAPVAIGMLLVVGAVVLTGRGKSLRAQAPPVLDEGPKLDKGAAPTPLDLPPASRSSTVGAGQRKVQGEVPLDLPPAADAVGLPNPAEPAAPPAPGGGPAPAPEDPDKAAEAFMNQTRAQADAQIKALNTEAEQLRTRLKKVESAIGRWQSLRAALALRPAQGQALAPPPAAELPLPAVSSELTVGPDEPPLLQTSPPPLGASAPASPPPGPK